MFNYTIYVYFFCLFFYQTLIGQEAFIDCKKCEFFGRTLPYVFCATKNEFTNPLKVRLKSEKNILIFAGKPGTGKSILVEEFARQTNSFLITIETPGALNSGYVGCGSKKVEESFDTAIKHIKETGQNVILHFEEVDAIACYENQSANKEASRAYQLFNVLSDKYKEESKLLITCTTNYYEKCASEFRSRCILVEVDQIVGKERIETFKKLLIDEGIKKLEKQLSDFSLKFETKFKNLKTSINEKLKILRYKDSEEEIIKLFDELKILLGHIITLIRDDEKRNNFHKSLDHIDSSKNQYLTTESSIILLDEIESLLTNIDEDQIYSLGHFKKLGNEILETAKSLCKIKEDKEKLQKITALISRFSDLTNKEKCEEIKKFGEQFNISLRAFLKVYNFALKEDKITAVLSGLESKSTRFLSHFASMLRNSAKSFDLNDANVRELKHAAEKTEPIVGEDLEKAKEESRNYILRTLKNVNEVAKEYWPLIGLTGTLGYFIKDSKDNQLAQKVAQAVSTEIAKLISQGTGGGIGTLANGVYAASQQLSTIAQGIVTTTEIAQPAAQAIVSCASETTKAIATTIAQEATKQVVTAVAGKTIVTASAKAITKEMLKEAGNEILKQAMAKAAIAKTSSVATATTTTAVIGTASAAGTSTTVGGAVAAGAAAAGATTAAGGTAGAATIGAAFAAGTATTVGGAVAAGAIGAATAGATTAAGGTAGAAAIGAASAAGTATTVGSAATAGAVAGGTTGGCLTTTVAAKAAVGSAYVGNAVLSVVGITTSSAALPIIVGGAVIGGTVYGTYKFFSWLTSD